MTSNSLMNVWAGFKTMELDAKFNPNELWKLVQDIKPEMDGIIQEFLKDGSDKVVVRCLREMFDMIMACLEPPEGQQAGVPTPECLEKILVACNVAVETLYIFLRKDEPVDLA